MAVDLTKLAFHSGYPAFINNTEYTDTLTISGSVSPGTNTRTYAITLDMAPDLLDVIFNGPSNASNPRPDDGWFKQGLVWTPTSGGDISWVITTKTSGTTVTVTATHTKQSLGTDSVTSTDFNYKIVDYSVFSSDFAFDSRENYMKRSEFVDNTNLTLASGPGSPVTYNVTHSLGYIPFFIVGAELNDASTIWSNNRVHEFTKSSSAGGAKPVQLFYWCTDTTLTIRLENGTGALEQSGDRTVYWGIYLDYS